MKRLKLLLPVTALFVSPWMHRALFENIILAIPSTGEPVAHFLALSGSFAALMVTGFMAAEL